MVSCRRRCKNKRRFSQHKATDESLQIKTKPGPQFIRGSVWRDREMLERQEKTIEILGKQIRIRELSTEEESKIKSQSQVWNSKKKMPEVDQAKLDANIICHSVLPETWPSEWGTLSAENIRKLPSKLTRRLLHECQSLNILDEDVASFLDSQSSSQTPQEVTSSSTQ